MTNKERPIFNYKFYILIIGVTLILFSSLYIFTRPAIWNDFDFSNTGQIGDTIGGITAPIINLIGAILIFLSFKAQINANKIQFTLLNNEIENQKKDRNFQVILDLFQALKNDFQNLAFENYTGMSAINAYVNQIRDYWTKENFESHSHIPIYSDWKFLMAEYDLISFHIETSDLRATERTRLKSLIKNYFFTQLEYPTNSIKKQLVKFEQDSDVLKIVNDILEFNKKK
ncbi:hypothetical protein [Bizionia myxarmorum]|uniref:Phage abortive infection protein n=1 Tax=Bizionia myxarmorum TaxID=291186 RepID=A0A5D0QWB3_9FLAO|nr:hypothetical protein [Bizionia myxarmorum]TYB73159.1 hypothetical protein ES674_15270 [Bizionia myxarmorum]